MVALRMFTEAELGYFDVPFDPVADPYAYFGLRPSTVRARFAANELVGPARGTLAVDLDGLVIGDVQWHAVSHGPPPMSDALNIGISLLPAHRGRGHGAAAQAALAGYLLDTYPVNRVEASTDVTNIAEQRALAKAGFAREGVLRGAQWRAGQWHDMVSYSRLRGDPPTAGAAEPGPVGTGGRPH